MKKCTKCGQDKPLGEFFKHRWCNACHVEYSQKYRAENKEKIIESNKKWYAENKEKKRESHKKRLLKNPEKKGESYKKWVAKNPEKELFFWTKGNLKRQIGETPPPELVEVKVLISKTKKLCKTLKN